MIKKGHTMDFENFGACMDGRSTRSAIMALSGHSWVIELMPGVEAFNMELRYW